MKDVATALAADIALRTLGADERRQVHAWLDHLRHWDDDPGVRADARELPTLPGVYLLPAGPDVRLFLRVDGGTVTVLDIAKQRALDVFAGRG